MSRFFVLLMWAGLACAALHGCTWISGNRQVTQDQWEPPVDSANDK